MKTEIISLHPLDSVAQLVEQMTLNHWVESSILSRVTNVKGLWLTPGPFLFASQLLNTKTAREDDSASGELLSDW